MSTPRHASALPPLAAVFLCALAPAAARAEPRPPGGGEVSAQSSAQPPSAPAAPGEDGDEDARDDSSAAELSADSAGAAAAGSVAAAGFGLTLAASAHDHGLPGALLGALGFALLAQELDAEAAREQRVVRETAPSTHFSDEGGGYGPYRVLRERKHDAREGFLFALGAGAGQNYLSGVGHAVGAAFDLRVGYGFSDRFQLFFDLSALPADYGHGLRATSWTGTLRGQTVLIGDRRGNGLNLNLGGGLGGLDSYGDRFVSQRIGFALAGGLSFDFRVAPGFSVSPEAFVQWHQVRNDLNRDSDVHRIVGGVLNFTWYSFY